MHSLIFKDGVVSLLKLMKKMATTMCIIHSTLRDASILYEPLCLIKYERKRDTDQYYYNICYFHFNAY